MVIGIKHQFRVWVTLDLETSDRPTEEGHGLGKTNRPAGCHAVGWALGTWPRVFSQAQTWCISGRERPRQQEGQARGCSPSPGAGTGTQLGGSTSPRCFPFALFTSFKNDFMVENEQTQPDLLGLTYTVGHKCRHTHAHTHIKHRGP